MTAELLEHQLASDPANFSLTKRELIALAEALFEEQTDAGIERAGRAPIRLATDTT